MTLWGRLWSGVNRLFRPRSKPLQTCVVEDIPEAPESGTVYLVGSSEPWCVVMACPCECGDVIHLSLLSGHPRWRLRVHPNRTVSLHPSVWRVVGCRSHFFLRKSLVVWCAPGEG